MGYPRIGNTYVSNATGSSGIIKVGSGAIFSFFVTNLATVTRYFMLFDRTTLPTTGAIPYLVFPVYGNVGYTEITQDTLTESGQVFDNGLVWGLSTDPVSYTAAATTDTLLQIRWA